MEKVIKYNTKYSYKNEKFNKKKIKKYIVVLW